MGEGRKSIHAWAVGIRPLPFLHDRSRETTDNGDALIGDGGGVGVLVAHHDEGVSVNGEQVMELVVA